MSQYQFNQNDFTSVSHECFCFNPPQAQGKYFLRKHRSFNYNSSPNPSPPFIYPHYSPPNLLVKRNSKRSLKKVGQKSSVNLQDHRKQPKLQENYQRKINDAIQASPIQALKQPIWGEKPKISEENLRFGEAYSVKPFTLVKAASSKVLPPLSPRYGQLPLGQKRKDPPSSPLSPRVTFKHQAGFAELSPRSCQAINENPVEISPIDRAISYGSSKNIASDRIKIRLQELYANKPTEIDKNKIAELAQEKRDKQIPDPPVSHNTPQLGGDLTSNLPEKSFIKGTEFLKFHIGDTFKSRMDVGRSKIVDINRSRINEANRSQVGKKQKLAVRRLKENKTALRRMDDVQEIRSLIDEDQRFSSDQQSVVLGRLYKYESAVEPLKGQESLKSKMLSLGTQPSLVKGGSFNYSFK